MRVGIIRCNRIEEFCPGVECHDALEARDGMFQFFKDEDLELVGYSTCGGHEKNEDGAKEAVKIARNMIDYGAEVIFLSTCLVRDLFLPVKELPEDKEEIKNLVRTALVRMADKYGEVFVEKISKAIAEKVYDLRCENDVANILEEKLGDKVRFIKGTHFYTEKKEV